MTCLSQIQVNIERHTCLKNQPFESTTTGPSFQALLPDLEILPPPPTWSQHLDRKTSKNKKHATKIWDVSGYLTKSYTFGYHLRILLNEILFIYSPPWLQRLKSGCLWPTGPSFRKQNMGPRLLGVDFGVPMEFWVPQLWKGLIPCVPYERVNSFGYLFPKNKLNHQVAWPLGGSALFPLNLSINKTRGSIMTSW